jgi:prevent-host-death family protein
MREVGVLEAKTHLSALLDAVEKDGEAVMITRNGRPVAKLSPLSEVAPRPRRATGAELVARSRALHAQIMASNPDLAAMTWEELKQLGRE